MRTCDLSLLPSKQDPRLLLWQNTNSKWYSRAHYAQYVVKPAQCLTGCCVKAHTPVSSQAMCASHLNGAGSSQLRTSVSKAAGWGRENAQLLGVLAGITAGLFWLGTYVSEIKSVNKVLEQKVSNFEKLMAKDREVVEEKVKAAKADGAKEMADRFLVYGYAAEYDKFREKIKGGAAANNADGDDQSS